MNYVNTIKINTDNLLSNIDTIKENYAYSYIILDVSNNAFNHGMYIIHYLKDKIDYLYVHDLSDLLLIRKYDKDIPVIYGGKVHQDNVYDLIINDAILVISNMEILKNIKSLNIKDKVTFILGIDPKGYFGIAKKEDILDYLEWDHKYFELVGVIAQIEEKDYDNFNYIIRPIKDAKLMILNHENDKRKIHGSNAIKLDASIYGINTEKKKLFQKNDISLKQVFTLGSKILDIKEITNSKKSKYVAIIPFGFYQGMKQAIKQVFIHNKLYPVKEIKEDCMLVEVGEDITKDMEVEIISSNNPLEKYFSEETLSYFSLFSMNIPIIFDDYILEKTLSY